MTDEVAAARRRNLTRRLLAAGGVEVTDTMWTLPSAPFRLGTGTAAHLIDLVNVPPPSAQLAARARAACGRAGEPVDAPPDAAICRKCLAVVGVPMAQRP